MTSISSAGMKWDDTSSQWTFTLPKSTPNGQYLLRFEHIALHSASSAGGAQFYISCAQINVTGGGSGSPSPQVSLPGAYTPTQPNIMINIYYPLVSKMTPEMGEYVCLGNCVLTFWVANFIHRSRPSHLARLDLGGGIGVAGGKGSVLGTEGSILWRIVYISKTIILARIDIRSLLHHISHSCWSSQ